MRGGRLHLIRSPGRAALLVPPAAFLAIFLAWPLSQILLETGSADAWRWLADGYARGRIGGAVTQATLSTLATLAVAAPLAWTYHRWALPRWHLLVHAAPFVLPVFVVVGAVRELFGAGGWIDTGFGIDTLATIGPLGAVVVAHVYYNYGFAARLLNDALVERPRHLEEAARVLGASAPRAFWHAAWPSLWPRFVGVALLVWLFCFTSFGVVYLLGQGAVSTLETLIYQNLGGAFPRADRAAVLGLCQLAINILLLGAYFALQRMRTVRDAARWRPQAANLRARTAARTGLALAMVPIAVVLLGGFRVQGEWTLSAWRAIFDADHPGHLPGFEFWPVIVRSLGYAAATLLASLALVVAAGYALDDRRRRGLAVRLATALPLGTSSVLLGLGFLVSFGAGSLIDLRGQAAAIVIVHTLIALPFVARVLLPAFESRDRRLDEAAASLGASSVGVAWRVHVGVLRRPLAAAAGFAVALSLGDFGAGLLLMRADTMGLAVWIGHHDQPFRALLHAQAVALSAVLMVLSAAAYALVERAVYGLHRAAGGR